MVATNIQEVSKHAHHYLEKDAFSELGSFLLFQQTFVLLLYHPNIIIQRTWRTILAR